MGTPDFAAESLAALLKCPEHNIIGVFCQPDKPKGRGMKLAPCPVKELALQNNIPVFQPDNFKDGSAEKILEELSPDITVVVAYGKLLSRKFIDIPRHGTLNVHASLLPRWRGSAPIQWAIMSGDKQTGVCIQQVCYELDEGDILSCSATQIGELETYGELYDRLKRLGAELLVDTLAKLHQLIPAAQIGESSYAPPIAREHCLIDLSHSAIEIDCQVRALNPKPGAVLLIGGEKLKIFRVTPNKDGQFTIPCGNCERIAIEELQAPNGKRMSVSDYLRGHKLPTL